MEIRKMPKLKAKKKQRKHYKLPSDMPEKKTGSYAG
jgi:hypothetical protein